VSGVLIIAYSVRSMLLRGRRNTVAANAAGLDQF
jgi:hypothetical protein